MKLFSLSILIFAAFALTARAQNAPPPNLPKAALELSAATPAAVIPVAQADVQAVLQYVQVANAYRVSIQALQEKVDAADAEAQRAFARAQALHPDMPIDTKTWTYTAKPKDVVK